MSILHTQYTTEQLDIDKVSETDVAINRYIENHGNAPYDSIISNDDRWQVFYNLSELRTGLISWYDFIPNAEVLELGAGFGALTGTLCRKCKHVSVTEKSLYRSEAIHKRYKDVKNLDIYAGDVSDIKFEKKFDYILLVGILETQGNGTSAKQKYTEYLTTISKLLKTNGKILTAVENRFGLRYFCGTPEPHTNRAFDGIKKYPNGTAGYSFSRQELVDILDQAGLSHNKFYYPLPDYKIPQLIYTDKYLPERNLKERLIPYYRRSDTLIAYENEIYDDIIDNKVFPFFANSFLVECSLGVSDKFCNVQYAAISTDRGKTRGFVTSIHDDKKVTKIPLYPEGMENAKVLYENICDLKNHGIPVADHRWVKDGLELDFISYPTLSNYLKSIIQMDVEKFKELIDRLYQYILQSSEPVQPVNNKLLLKLHDRGNDIENQGNEICSKEGSSQKVTVPETNTDKNGNSIENLTWGPILKKAYMELIPLNCFYDPEADNGQGKFLFFDQEFVRDNYPAKYILFRAIHYIYCFTPNAEQYLPQSELRDKYDFGDTWDYYLQEEQNFLNEVRNHEQYKQFYKWAAVDWKRIQENATRLESEEETVANFRISDKMKKIWKVELNILDTVDAICSKHNIKYFMLHGTLLGAVRHKGFIPWDDDLDIGMLRKDYDKFIEIASQELQGPLSLHTPQTETDSFYGGFARVRNSQTTAIETREMGHDTNLGIWIDILPIDSCTMNEKKIEKKQLKIRHCSRLLYAKIYGKDFEQFIDMKPVMWRWYRFLSTMQSHSSLYRKLENAMQMYSDENSEYVSIFSGYYKHRQLSRRDFDDVVSLDFEHRKVPAPIGYKNYLFMTMGKDYLKYPPVEERKPKHRGIYDPERPYEIYTKMLFDIFKDIKGKQIILFGAGMMFEDYMKKYGDKYHPSFLVDNDKNKWGRSRMGIKIKDPQDILLIPKEKRKLIICSFYYKEIETQLQKMGINDYQVYIQEVEWVIQAEQER